MLYSPWQSFLGPLVRVQRLPGKVNNFTLTMHLPSPLSYRTPASNCIKDFFDLPGDSGQSGLTLQLFQMVILANQV